MKHTLPLLLLLCLISAFCFCAEDPKKSTVDLDGVVEDLVQEIRDYEKHPAQAQDAALKLVRFGEKAVPALAELLTENIKKEKGNPQIVSVAVYTLSRIKSKTGNAARVLLPILEDPKTPLALRSTIAESPCIEYSDEAVAVLLKLAGNAETDTEFRKKILSQISVMPTAWLRAEKVFVEALSSTNVEIRILAAKQCYYCRVYWSAADKLIELAENDSDETVRIQSMLTLSRMKIRLAVPTLARVVTADATDVKLRALALRTLIDITGISLKDRATTQAWWEKSGQTEYGKVDQLKAELDALKSKQSAASKTKPVEPKTKPEAGTKPAPSSTAPKELKPLPTGDIDGSISH